MCWEGDVLVEATVINVVVSYKVGLRVKRPESSPEFQVQAPGFNKELPEFHVQAPGFNKG